MANNASPKRTLFRRLGVIHAHILPWGLTPLSHNAAASSSASLAHHHNTTTTTHTTVTMTHNNAHASASRRRTYASTASDCFQSLAGKTALVTGSTQGIGLDIARVLYDSGAHVVLNGFGDPQAIESTVASFTPSASAANRAVYVAADMSKVEEIEQLIAQAEEKLNAPIDILINNAGIQHVSSVAEFPTAKWDQLLAVNLSAVFHTMRLTLPKMKEKGYGRVINISSVHGLVASKNKSAYVAAKHGVVGLTKVSALEYAGTGVTCNCINPGWVLTDLVKKQIEAVAASKNMSYEDASHALLFEKQPSLQFVTGKQLGLAALFLCNESTAQLTGVSLPVDGGWTAQ